MVVECNRRPGLWAAGSLDPHKARVQVFVSSVAGLDGVALAVLISQRQLVS